MLRGACEHDYPCVGEILRFYIQVARFQEQLKRALSATLELEGLRIQASLRPGRLSEPDPRLEAVVGLPLREELASAPLDLWARERGYAKLHANLFGMWPALMIL